MEKNRTDRIGWLLSQKATDLEMKTDYIDEDLIVIDNIKLLGVNNAVYTNMNLLAYCAKGKCQIDINGENHIIHANQIFICPPEMSLDNILISPDFEYQAICIANRMLQIALRSYINVWNQLTYVKKLRVIDMQEEALTFYTKAYELIKICLDMKKETCIDDKYQTEVIHGIISSVLKGFCYVLQKHQDKDTITTPQNTSLFNQFLELLQTTEAKHNTVEAYASQLCISAKYLTVISKKNSGKTANAWIQEYTLAAISNYLRTTELSVKEISNRLGFPNTSFFGKYVKDHFGCSPLAYRRQKSI